MPPLPASDQATLGTRGGLGGGKPARHMRPESRAPSGAAKAGARFVGATAGTTLESGKPGAESHSPHGDARTA